jgi:aminopeptidase-like protein
MNLSEKIKLIDSNKKGKDIFNLIEKMYPICRSITGNGVRETLSIISKIIPVNIHEIPSKTKILDWEVPLEWNIKDAWIKNEKGEKIIDFKNSNLHVLNYSIPINKKVNLHELKEHLFTLPDYPDWIPYRTSYHNKEWGFCLPFSQFKELNDEIYEVKIDSKLEKGSLTYGEFFIKGQKDDEVLISTHICHPSLANDNLSGIAVSVFIADFLSKIKTKFSYRFLFIPATIGSITWLSLNEDKIKKIKFGMVLNLLGDSAKFNYKKSRNGNTEIDKIVQNCLKHYVEDYGILDFSPYGYDERQYCSPGYNLPVGRLSRSIYGEFPEYHNSADNLDFIKQDKLEESFELLLSIIQVIEDNKTFINLISKGEPQLGKRGLFKKIGGDGETKEYQMALLWILNQSDGENSLLDISVKSGINFILIEKAAEDLENVDLIKEIKN